MHAVNDPKHPYPRLPDTFAFSQSSLQAYQDCPRRFWLAYVEQLPWPAVEAAPVQDHEQLMRLGAAFHRLVERVEIGLDPALLAASLPPPLDAWFAAYQAHRPAHLPEAHKEVERILSVPFGLEGRPDSPEQGFRLAAKYDLIAADPEGRVVIVDWKTSRRRPEPATLRQRLQSLIYPYVLVEASPSLPWGPVQPEQVEMLYWFTAAPEQPIRFRYDGSQHQENQRRLQQLLAEILAGQRPADFPKVPDTEANRRRFCQFCVYRSRCNRGTAAGDLDDVEDMEDFFAVDVTAALEFTLDDVAELAF